MEVLITVSGDRLAFRSDCEEGGDGVSLELVEVVRLLRPESASVEGELLLLLVKVVVIVVVILSFSKIENCLIKMLLTREKGDGEGCTCSTRTVSSEPFSS